MSWFLAGAAISAVSQIAGGAKAKKAGKEGSRNAWAQTLEEARRLEYQQEENIEAAEASAASNVASMGGAGVTQSGTAQVNMDRDTSDIADIETEQGKQLDWLLKSGKMRASEIRKSGNAAWYQGVMGGVSSGVQAWGKSVGETE